MSTWTVIGWLTLGGTTGAILRGWLSEYFGSRLPWTTLFINVTGSFVSGWVNARYGGQPEKAWLLTFIVVGACGGYTTFSTLALQLLIMWRERRSGRLALYLGLTLVLGLAAAWAGLAAGKA